MFDRHSGMKRSAIRRARCIAVMEKYGVAHGALDLESCADEMGLAALVVVVQRHEKRADPLAAWIGPRRLDREEIEMRAIFFSWPIHEHVDHLALPDRQTGCRGQTHVECVHDQIL